MNTVEPAVFRRQEAHIYPVILCGASVLGEKREPDDRACYLVSAGRGRSTFQEALLWNTADAGLAAPIIVVDHKHRFLVAEQLADIGIVASSVILEPGARSGSTAAGLAVAALQILPRDPEALMLVQPVDHAGHTPGQFHEAFALSLSWAYSSSIVSFAVDGRRQGGAGLFLIATARYIAALRTAYPKLLEACERSLDAAVDGLGYLRPEPVALPWPTLPVEKALEGMVDITLRVPVGDARGELGRRALQSLTPPSSYTGEKHVGNNVP